MASFNDVYDPYASGKVEEFIVTFQFYHDGELVREQKISNLPITLTYTPIPDPTGEPEKFGVVFNPVEVDSDGD
ncbi:MAG: hypothetical protein MJ195_02745 [Mycoplasmoidaceae bacterium]|nr:hypothetical protein [Mycoplasmoidaceae bacterium]